LSIKDRRPLIRTYAIYALSFRAQGVDRDFLISRLLSESNYKVKVSILFALYDSGYTGTISEIIKMFRCSDYEAQCMAINGVCDIDLGKYLAEVVRELEEIRADKNQPRAVTSTAEEALGYLTE
jgi:hypothetical protein